MKFFLSIIYSFLPVWLKITYYKVTGRRPWSKGYLTYKFKYVERIINNQQIMERFRNSESLPEKYGYALDERVVEYPWLLSRFPQQRGKKLLDAGSTLNFKEILNFPSLKNKNITIVNLNPEENCFWQEGISYVFEDIRSLPFKDNNFDYITCISTLEHIGMDNVIYTKDVKNKEEKIFDFEKCILEMKRVLKDGGRLFITVPFGKYKNYGRFQQFDPRLVSRISEIFQPRECRINYYKYTRDGWNISDEASCRDVESFDVLQTKYFDKKSNHGFDEDSAAAARAVACMELVK